MGQDTSSPIQSPYKSHPQRHFHKSNKSTHSHLHHQNILRIASTPFEGCQKAEMEGETYFIEHTINSMDQYLKSQKRLKKRLSNESIMKLIENVAYALAFLESANLPYPLLTLHNVFRCRNQFKILPPIALKSEIYCKLKRFIREKVPQYVPASPEMIIAARCQEPEIEQNQILFKSNVFAFGLLLLEACTQKCSSQCYDLETYEILDETITARIEEIEQNYSNKIVRVIANMLDYDYEERMTPKQLSVWINREFHEIDQVSPNQQEKEEPRQKQEQEKSTVRSRFIIETEHCRSGKKQPNAKTQTKDLNPTRTSEKRMKEIRAKLNQEKKMERISTFDISSKSTNPLLSKSPSFAEKQTSCKKFIPNPYLNQSDLIIQAKNAPMNKVKDHEDSQVSSSSKANAQKYQNRYQYQEPNIKPSKGSGLKYKYDIDSDDETKYSPKPSNFDQGCPSKRNYARGYSRNINENVVYNYNNRKDDKNAITFDFSLEPHNYQQLEETKKMKAYEKYNQIEISSKRTLLPKENEREFSREQNMFEKQKNSKQDPYENRKSGDKEYGRSEQKEKQNSKDISKIKSQIQKSKSVIEHVKRIGSSSYTSYL